MTLHNIKSTDTNAPATTADLIAQLRRNWNEQEKKGAHASGNGLSDAEKATIKATVDQADLIGDKSVQTQLLGMFADRAKRYGHELPEDRLPEVLLQLQREFNARNANHKDRMVRTVRDGAPEIPAKAPAPQHKREAIPVAAPFVTAVKPAAAIPSEEETKQFMSDMRAAFVRHYTKLIIAQKISTDINNIVENTAAVAGYHLRPRKLLLATFAAMARHCDTKAEEGETRLLQDHKIPAGHMPKLVQLLESEMDQNSHIFKDPNSCMLATIRLGAFGPEAKKNYPKMPDSIIQHSVHFPDPRDYLARVQKLYDTSNIALSKDAKYYFADSEIASTTVRNPHLSKKARVAEPVASPAEAGVSALQSVWGMRVSPLPESKTDAAINSKDDPTGHNR